jgi:hypothetical protein
MPAPFLKGDSRRRTQRLRRGFTLVEAALATVIIGTGVLAIVFAQQTFHKQNSWASRAATGMRLASEIREMTFNLPRHDPVTGTDAWGPEANESGVVDYDDVDDFDGAVFSHDLGNGPLSAMRDAIQNMPGWSQRVEVWNVDPFDIHTSVDNGTTELLRVDVIVEYQSQIDLSPNEVTRLSWVQTR